MSRLATGAAFMPREFDNNLPNRRELILVQGQFVEQGGLVQGGFRPGAGFLPAGVRLLAVMFEQFELVEFVVDSGEDVVRVDGGFWEGQCGWVDDRDELGGWGCWDEHGSDGMFL
uniref:(northern house mosquito) hypothetical protein n=1 Tax=Culex pipiens TaxID=7175 RepID=A0A8D8P845_CULPI